MLFYANALVISDNYIRSEVIINIHNKYTPKSQNTFPHFVTFGSRGSKEIMLEWYLTIAREF